MHEKTTSVCGRRPQRKSAVVSLRAGIARDKLIFIIICSVAVTVAVVTLAVTQFSGGDGTRSKWQWQCLEHGHEFSSRTKEMSPIECPKCSGDAVKLIYRKCPKCGENTLVSRMRLTKQGQERREAMKTEERPRPGISMMGPTGLTMEVQFWYKQEDGSYAWSDWVPMGRRYRGQVCLKCGASLYGGK